MRVECEGTKRDMRGVNMSWLEVRASPLEFPISKARRFRSPRPHSLPRRLIDDGDGLRLGLRGAAFLRVQCGIDGGEHSGGGGRVGGRGWRFERRGAGTLRAQLSGGHFGTGSGGGGSGGSSGRGGGRRGGEGREADAHRADKEGQRAGEHGGDVSEQAHSRNACGTQRRVSLSAWEAVPLDSVSCFFRMKRLSCRALVSQPRRICAARRRGKQQHMQGSRKASARKGRQAIPPSLCPHSAGVDLSSFPE